MAAASDPDADAAPRKNAPAARGRPFERGNSGRPRGCRNRVTVAVQDLLDGEAERLTRVAIERALAGDLAALKLCLDRVAPPAKDRSIAVTLPPIESARQVPTALAALVAATAEGQLAPAEAAQVAGILGQFVAAYDATELETRLAALECAAGIAR